MKSVGTWLGYCRGVKGASRSDMDLRVKNVKNLLALTSFFSMLLPVAVNVKTSERKSFAVIPIMPFATILPVRPCSSASGSLFHSGRLSVMVT